MGNDTRFVELGSAKRLNAPPTVGHRAVVARWRRRRPLRVGVIESVRKIIA